MEEESTCSLNSYRNIKSSTAPSTLTANPKPLVKALKINPAADGETMGSDLCMVCHSFVDNHSEWLDSYLTTGFFKIHIQVHFCACATLFHAATVSFILRLVLQGEVRWGNYYRSISGLLVKIASYPVRKETFHFFVSINTLQKCSSRLSSDKNKMKPSLDWV